MSSPLQPLEEGDLPALPSPNDTSPDTSSTPDKALAAPELSSHDVSTDAEDAPHSTKAQTFPAPNRRARAREKQRLRRQLKRELKRAEVASRNAEAEAALAASAVIDEKAKRHRPSPVERSMAFFMKMHDWSRFFTRNTRWMSHLQSGGYLDQATLGAIWMMKQCLDPEPAGESERGFRKTFLSVDHLERFADAKAKEAAYIERQLVSMPSLQDPAWESYFASIQRDIVADLQVSASEALEAPASLLCTILPYLKTQVEFLQSWVSKGRELYQRLVALQKRIADQNELRQLLQCLQETQSSLLPICPVWKEVEAQIKGIEQEIICEKDLTLLSLEREQVWQAYQDVLRYS